MPDNKILVKEMVAFTEQFVKGTLRALYRTMKGDVFLHRVKFTNLFQICAVEYLNRCYKSTILRDDEYVVKTFDIMMRHGHSLVCLLHMILAAAKGMFETVLFFEEKEVEDLDIFSHHLHLKTKEYLLLLQIVWEHKLSHTCSGYALKDLDANISLFTLQEKREGKSNQTTTTAFDEMGEKRNEV